MNTTFIHHGTMFSYYSAKTRAYLSYKKIPFVELYDGKALAGRIKEKTNKIMIPVVETPLGEILQDTTAIIDTLEARFPERPVMPQDPVMLLITRIVEFFVDELWITTAMNSRWNDPVSKAFAISEFGRCFGAGRGLNDDKLRAIGERMAGQMQAYLPRLGIAQEQGQRAASELFQQASIALNQVLGAKRFALGDRPSLIDFCLYEAYYAHQYRDLGSAGFFLKSKTPGLCYFIDNLHAAQCLSAQGELKIPPPLLNYLSVIGPISAEFASGTIRSVNKAAAGDADLSLAGESLSGDVELDFVSMTFDGHPLLRATSTFAAWKLQRVLDVYTKMNPSDQARATQLAAEFGWSEVLQTTPKYTLAREDYQIKLVS